MGSDLLRVDSIATSLPHVWGLKAFYRGAVEALEALLSRCLGGVFAVLWSGNVVSRVKAGTLSGLPAFRLTSIS